MRLEYLHRNPAASVLKLKETPQEKSTLTPDQVRELFRDDRIDEVWDGDLKHYTLNLLAAWTGMRLGECQALQVENVHREGYISIVYSWDPKYGLIEPKWGSGRDVPIPGKTLYYIGELIGISPYQGPEDLVFFDNERDKPLRGEIVLKVLYSALEKIGISPEERVNKNITFHSWRYFYNSLMRGKIPDAKLRRLTGHKTLEMTEHYTHFNLKDFRDVLEIQEGFLK